MDKDINLNMNMDMDRDITIAELEAREEREAKEELDRLLDEYKDEYPEEVIRAVYNNSPDYAKETLDDGINYVELDPAFSDPEEALGYQAVEDGALGDLPEKALSYLDYSAIGHDISFNGYFTDDNNCFIYS